MSTIISTRERAKPLILDTRVKPTRGIFSGVVDAISEIGYCLKLSAQSLSFSTKAPASATYGSTSAARLDVWPVDLWVF